MAVSTKPKGNTSGTLKYVDGTAMTPVELTSSFERGDFKVTGLQAGGDLNEVTPVQRRGVFVGLIKGARTFPQLSWSCWVTQFTEASGTGTDADFLLQQGAYSGNVSTSGTGCPYTIDIDYTVEGTDFGDSADHNVVFADFHADTVDYEEGADGNFLAVSGTVYGAITGDLAAAGLT